MVSDFLRDARADREWIVTTRRDIHRHPELGFDLERTAALVEIELQRLGIETRRAAVTGVVGRLRGDRPGPVVALRADMDGLELDDRKAVPYASAFPGRMHACGHDAHTAMLLGAARLLARRRHLLAGEVRFLFQPAEEGDGGALPMIGEGALTDPDVDAVFGLHVAPEFAPGTIGLSRGKLHAASDLFDLVLSGRTSHGAKPHLGVDALAVGAQVLSALQQIVSRQTDPLDPIVVTVGTFHGGTRRNIIAGRAEMTGIIRTVDAARRVWARQKVREVAEGVASALGARAELRFTEGYPCLVNDGELARYVETVASDLLGDGAVRIMEKPTMGVDDFAYFVENRPGVLVMLGTGDGEKETCHPLHSDLFDIDEAALPMGAALLARIAADFAGRRPASEVRKKP